MAILVAAGWDFARIGAFSVQVTDAGGSNTIAFALGTYSHVDISTVVTDYASFPVALQTALNAATNLTNTYAITYNAVTNRYSFSATGGAWSFASANAVAQRVLGLDVAAGNSTAGPFFYTYAPVNQPYYGILGEMGAASNKTDDYEPNAITEGAVADDGTPYAVSVTTAPVYCDFVLPLEPKAKTHERAATATVPWTFQHFFRHVRGSEPFAVVDDIETTVHKLRADATHFRPQQVTVDYDDHWNVPFQTHVLGRP
jgi:hypothetical protein